MIDWAKANQKKITVLAIGAVLIYLTNGPFAERPEVAAAEYFLKGLAVAIGVGG